MADNIVKAESQAQRYNYASLSDIAKQGYRIPKMNTGTDAVSMRDYVYYYDDELKVWVRGAEIVVPSPILNNQGKATMNEAQLYGSALTYARRYTVMMSLGLVCDDDKELEAKEGYSNSNGKATPSQINYIKKLFAPQKLPEICQHYKVDKLEDLSSQDASTIIGKATQGQKR